MIENHLTNAVMAKRTISVIQRERKILRDMGWKNDGYVPELQMILYEKDGRSFAINRTCHSPYGRSTQQVFRKMFDKSGNIAYKSAQNPFTF